jgi:alpha-tubulin suppressor-like RCC1 family protein
MKAHLFFQVADTMRALIAASSAILIAVGCSQANVHTPPPPSPTEHAAISTPTPTMPTSTTVPTSSPQPSTTPTPGQTPTRTPLPPLEVTAVIGGSASDYMVLLTREKGFWLVYGDLDRFMPTETIIDAAVGPHHIMALTQSGAVYAFGYNRHGQLGTDNTEDIQETPVVVAGIDHVSAITAGVDFSVALKEDGTVWGWGENDAGQVGGEIAEYRARPAQIAGLSNIAAVSSGGGHTLALRNDGVILAWGSNGSGQLGNGTTETKLVPVQVMVLNDVVAISAGGGHSLALKDDGTVWSWGGNNRGQLGVRTDASHSTVPIQILGLSDIVAITAGSRYSLAVTKDGEVWAWGENGVGQLGIGDTEERESFVPVKVEGIAGIVSVAAGRYRTVALQRDGTLWGWGDRTLLPGLSGSSIQTTPTIILGQDSP